MRRQHRPEGMVLLLILVLLGGIATAGHAQAETFASGSWGEVLGADRDRLDLAAGVFDIQEDRTAALRLEARSGRKLGFVGLAAGGLATTEGGLFGYAGVYADIAVRHLVFTPLLAAGAYRRGSGKDLGGTLQFRSALTVAFRLNGGSRFGVQFAHISNADLHHDNPGQNDLLLSCSFP